MNEEHIATPSGDAVGRNSAPRAAYRAPGLRRLDSGRGTGDGFGADSDGYFSTPGPAVS